MEDIIVGYENTMTRWYVRNVDRLHRRYEIETKPQRLTLVVLQKCSTTDGTHAGSKWIIVLTEKLTKTKKTEGMPLC